MLESYRRRKNRPERLNTVGSALGYIITLFKDARYVIGESSTHLEEFSTQLYRHYRLLESPIAKGEEVRYNLKEQP